MTTSITGTEQMVPLLVRGVTVATLGRAFAAATSFSSQRLVTTVSEFNTTTYGEDGSPIVFCHGLFGQGRNWRAVAKSLAGEHRTVLVDLPHHGRSPWSESFDYVDVADQVAEQVKTNILDQGIDGICVNMILNGWVPGRVGLAGEALRPLVS